MTMVETPQILPQILNLVSRAKKALNTLLSLDWSFEAFVWFGFTLDSVNTTDCVNPLSPKVKISILICFRYTFLIEVVGKSC